MLRRSIPVVLIVLAAGAAAAQSPLPHRYVAVDVDSGLIDSPGVERGVLFDETVHVEGASGCASTSPTPCSARCASRARSRPCCG